ncbi:adenylate cyclase [Chloropicon primus]|uniref:Adenylate cyclase n=1 Tax=Chloropicon primus TaxID=1764295 RepID=A0A5B8MW06_9CHLO|nr:adenylate cyclase [Chloropicon primus]|eukprot:QDZ24719.1 adenylate cyclase [Chloropicon primus]
MGTDSRPSQLQGRLAFPTVTGGTAKDDDDDDDDVFGWTGGDDESDNALGTAQEPIPGAPFDINNAASQLGGLREDINWERLLQSRLWDSPPPDLTRAEKASRASQLSGLAPYQGAAFNPSLSGLICSPDGVSIQAMEADVFYNSEAESSRGGQGTEVSCLWIMDFPPALPDGTLIGVRVQSFSSNSPATLRGFSGMQTCVDDDSLFLRLHIGDDGFSSLEYVQNVYAFIPTRDKSIAIQLDVDVESYHGQVANFTGFELELNYFPIWRQYPPPPGENGERPEKEDDDVELDDGVLQGWMSLYGSQKTSFQELADGNPTISEMTGVDEGIFIFGNPYFESLEGIQRIKTIGEGSVVISNNPRLHMPIATVIDWLNSLEGNLTSVDLSFNDFHGQIPESYCDLLARVPKIDLGQNINLCGAVPSCMSEVNSEVRSPDYFYDDEDFQYEGWDDPDDTWENVEDYYEDFEDVTRLQSFMDLWAGNNIGESCEALNLTSGFSDNVIGCSPLGYTTKLDTDGEIIFDSLGIEMQKFKDTSCSWQLSTNNDYDMDNIGERSVLVLNFNRFHTSINGDQAICNDFSSGHNFNNPMLNGPTLDQFAVSIYNDTYKRGLDLYVASGSELPPPFVLKVDSSYKFVRLQLKQKTMSQIDLNLARMNGNRTIQQCGGTSVSYEFVEPISTVANLTSFIAKHRSTVTGELGRSIIIGACRTMNGSAIEDLSALENVTKIKGSLIIVDCPTLRSLKGTEKLLNVTDSIIFQANNELTDISSLKSLRDLGRSLVLDGNVRLKNLVGLENLSRIGQSVLLKMTGLRSLKGLGGVQSIGGKLTIINNAYLKSMDGVYSLTRIGTSLTLKYNPLLKNLSGLEFLMEIGGSLDVQLNQKLLNLRGLENLATINGSFALFNNLGMTSVDQLTSLTHVAGSFVIGSNENLVSVSLPAIKALGSPLPSKIEGGTQDGRRLLSDGEEMTVNERDEKFNHIFAVEYNTNLKYLNISKEIEHMPWNVYISENQKLSGFIPWDLMSKQAVRQATLSYNNYSGPIDPYLCQNTTTIERLDISGNGGVCGTLPDFCEDLDVTAEDTDFHEACSDIVPPMCVFLTQDSTIDQCDVLAKKYSSEPTQLSFTFPRYELQDDLPKNFNATIKYEFGIGTNPGDDNVNPMTNIGRVEFIGPNDTMIRHNWNLEERHMALVDGETYYVIVNAYDMTGVKGNNITSAGTTIDLLPPNVTGVKVALDVDVAGHYRVKWDAFMSNSGISQYAVKLLRGRDVIDKVAVSGNETMIESTIPPSQITNGTLFSAHVTGVSNAGLPSPQVVSPSVIPIPNMRKGNTETIIGVAVGVTLACLCIAGLAGYFVWRYQKRQKERAREEEWLRKLNNSVYTYLQGTGTKAGKLSAEEGSVCLTNDATLDSDNTRDCIFIFTDIQSSTKLCEQDADAYLLLQEAHDEIMRNALAELGGHEVDTEGDAFQCMFPNVVTSLLFCFKVQEDLLKYDWPPAVQNLHECEKVESKLYRNKYVWSGPRVRMAVHFAKGGTYMAKSHPTTRRVAYGGKPWQTTSMLSDVGHGGQILVSEAAWRQLMATGDEGAAGYPIFEDLGRYQIDEEGLPIRILQVSPARSSVCERVFPALRDVDMLDKGQGMNIVPSMDGKVAIVCAIIEPSRFFGVVENFITLIGKRERASKNAPVDVKRDALTASDALVSPVFVPDYQNPLNESARSGLGRSQSFTITGRDHSDMENVGALDDALEKLGLKEASDTMYFTNEHHQAVEIVSSTLEALVSQFGGYVIRTVEEVDSPQQMMMIAFKTSSSAVRFTLAAQTTLMEYPWPKSINEAFGYDKSYRSSRGTPLFNGPCVAMSAHVDHIEKFSLFDSETYRSSSAGHTISYKYKGILQALELAHIASGGQTVLSSSFFDSKWQRGLSLSQTQVTDLGAHDVRYFAQPVKLIEMLPKVLQDRTNVFGPLESQRILSVGAQNAPGAHGEHVALVFTYPRVAQAFQKSGLASKAVDNFSQTVRILLARYNGYESQEVGTGCFFLSFPTVDDAVAWSVHLQLILRRADWNSSDPLLGLEEGEEESFHNSGKNERSLDSDNGEFSSFYDEEEKMGSAGISHVSSTEKFDEMDGENGEDSLFSFFSTHNAFYKMSLQMRHMVLVQIGICYGMPTKVTPHVQTGRADYFGPMVNLSARVAKNTKPGDIQLSSYADLSQVLGFGDDRDHPSCFLKGMEFANEGKWVDIDLNDKGMRSFKGVKDKRQVFSVQVSSDPYSLGSSPS